MKDDEKLTEYRFNQAILRPDESEQLKYGGKSIHLSPRQLKLLTYLLDNAGRVKTRDDILAAVWGPGEHAYATLSRTVYALHELLPTNCRITSVRNVGYSFDHKVERDQMINPMIEYRLKYSPRFRQYLKGFIAMCSSAIIASASYAFTNLYYDINPVPRFELESIDPKFTRSYTNSMPRFSPDQQFIAHRLSTEMYVNDALGLLNLRSGDTKPLVKMGFFDGFKWNLTGDKIVYQNTTAGHCEIRLVRFHDDNKTTFSDEHLSDCFNTSGRLSFAWFNDEEFFVNFVGEQEIKSANGLPLHHLYTFNIKTKQKHKRLTAQYNGGVGFYALEYDRVTDTLYFLQSEDFVSTYFYQYKNNQLTQLAKVEYVVHYFTVDNDTLIYKNDVNQFVINQPADDFAGGQLLLRGQPLTISQPHLSNNKLVYLVGDTFHFNLQQWQQQTLTDIDIQGFSANVLASMDGQLIFASAKTGIYQVYLLQPNGQIKQISDMTTNQLIRHIEVVADIFVLSYIDKVVLFRFEDQQLKPLKTYKGYHRGVLNAAGDSLLLTQLNADDGSTSIYQLRLTGMFNRPQKIATGSLAFYHHNEVVYLNPEHELIRLSGGQQQVIATGVFAKGIEYSDVNGDEFYYVEQGVTRNVLYQLNLISGEKNPVDIGQANPSKIQVLGERLLLRSKQVILPKIVTGDVAVYGG